MGNPEMGNYEELCRLCASFDVIKMDIFSDKGRQRRLVDKITTCLPFEVSENDLYPKSLCYRCIYNLETFYDFRSGCIAAKAKLESVIKQANEKISRDKAVLNERRRHDHEEGITLSDDEQRPNPADFLEACLGEAPSPIAPSGVKPEEEWGPFCCKTCGRTFHSRSSLTIHAKYHQEKSDAEREIYSCFVCDKVFSSKGHLALHSRVHIGEASSPVIINPRGSPSPTVKIYRCDLCNKSYSMAKHLWGHVSTCHKGDPLVTCSLCMRTFSSISNLEDHKKVKHKDENIDIPIQAKYPSIENIKLPTDEVVINLATDDSSDMKAGDEMSSNRRKSTKPRKIEREFSGVGDGEGDDSQITNQQENGPIYPCLACPQKFNDHQKLNEHVQSTHGYETGLSLDSFREFGENEYVDSMMEAETVFCCEICIREFNDRASLWLHMLYSHREEASKACGICLKICGDTETLAQHVESCHPRNKTEQRRYSCQVCARQHDSRKKLVTHAKIHRLTDSQGNLIDPETVVVLNSDYYPAHDISGGHTPMPPMQSIENHFPSCEVCFKVFESEAKLNKHKRGAHKDLNSSNMIPYHLFFACELCGLSHLSRSERWRHMVSLHSGDPAVTCQQPECGKVFPTSNIKREHEETHHSVQGQYPNTCEVCGKMWKTRVEYWKHMMGVHPDYLPFVCGVCLKVFIELSALVNHVRSTHWPLVGGDFCCDICGRPYSKVAKMARHRKVHYVPTTCPELRAILDNPKIEGVAGSIKITNDRHFLLVGDSPALCCDLCQNEEERVEYPNLEELGKHRFEKHNVMPCDLCPKYYGRTSHLWKHVNKIHKGHPDVTCPVCHRTSASKSHLVSHIAKHHKVSDGSDGYKTGENGEAICIKCNKVFRTESLVRKHVKHCKGPRPSPLALPPPENGTYTCERCEKTFSAENLLYKHMRSSHIMYKCELCPAKMTSRTDLYNHVKGEHSDDPNVKCAVRDCTQVMRCKADLDRHVRDHRQHSLLHICIYCAEILTNKFKLKRHLKSMHPQDSKHLCFLCIKPFASFADLRSHIVSAHAAALEKQNTCPVCAKPCSNKSKLTEHIKIHGPTFNPCRICPKILPSREELTEHLNNHPTDSADEEDLQIDEAALDPDSIMDIIGAPNDVTIKRSIEDEDEEKFQPPCKKIKEENTYSCVKCDTNFNTAPELSEHESAVHKTEDSKTSILESVLSEGKQLYAKSDDADVNDDMAEDRKKNGISKSDTDFMHQLGLMPDTSSDKPPVTPTTKLKIGRKVYANDDTPCKCEMCGKEWPAKRHLWQHLIRYHRADASTSCGVCLKYCASYMRLNVHLVMEHPDIFDGDGTNLSCKVCGKYHNARSKLLNHATVHIGEEVRAQASDHLCLICKEKFETFPQVVNHVESQHKSEMVQEEIRKPLKSGQGVARTTEKLPFYSCEICSLVFASAIGLANHRRIHEHADRFKCGQCGEVCPSASSLAAHKLERHQGTEFVCAHCKAQFTTYSLLTEHNRMCKAKSRLHNNDNSLNEHLVDSVNDDESEVSEEMAVDEGVENDDDSDNEVSKMETDYNTSVEDDLEDELETKSVVENEEGGIDEIDNEENDDEEDEGDDEEDEEEEEEEEEAEASETVEDVIDEEAEASETAEDVVDEEVDDDAEVGDEVWPAEAEEDDDDEEEEEEVLVEEEEEEESVEEEEEEEEEDNDDEEIVEEEDDVEGEDGEEGARIITEDQREVKAIEAFMCDDNMVEVVQVDLSDDCSSSKANDV